MSQFILIAIFAAIIITFLFVSKKITQDSERYFSTRLKGLLLSKGYTDIKDDLALHEKLFSSVRNFAPWLYRIDIAFERSLNENNQIVIFQGIENRIGPNRQSYGPRDLQGLELRLNVPSDHPGQISFTTTGISINFLTVISIIGVICAIGWFGFDRFAEGKDREVLAAMFIYAPVVIIGVLYTSLVIYPALQKKIALRQFKSATQNLTIHKLLETLLQLNSGFRCLGFYYNNQRLDILYKFDLPRTNESAISSFEVRFAKDLASLQHLTEGKL